MPAPGHGLRPGPGKPNLGSAQFRHLDPAPKAGHPFSKEETMTQPAPEVPQKSPIKVEVEAGKTYYWCTCGKSKGQPMCDGSHKGSPFAPLAYTADATGEKWLCACKHTTNAPMCDGTHKKL